jgi:hypothetical protein
VSCGCHEVNLVSYRDRRDLYILSIDREDDYGEEVKGEEKVREEAGGPGAQEEKDDKDRGKEVDPEGREESRAEEGCAEAQGAG